MINSVVLVGRLTADPTLRYTAAGKGVASGTMAVNRNFKNANGEQEADFINIVIWGKPAENTANFTKKGSLIGVTGRIQTRSYDTDNGRRYVTEVVAESVQFLEPKGGNTPQKENKPNTEPSDPFNGMEIDNDSLPF
jgi:single-strand DNA-binding protein